MQFKSLSNARVRSFAQPLSWLLAVGVAACCFTEHKLLADTPSAHYIFPAGGQRGTTTSFRIGAAFLHGQADFEMQGNGVKAQTTIVETETKWFEGPMIFKPASQRSENYPRDHAGKVAISADAELGFRYWRLRTSQGVTPSRPFVIGDLPEVIEHEVDGRPTPQHVDVPMTANGRIFPREDVDIWTFAVVKGRVYDCRVCAAEIQSPLDSRLQLFDDQGRLVAENEDDRSADSRIVFKAKRSGTYRITICDAQFRGLQDYVYRLTINDQPHATRVFPLGAKFGEPATFQLAGPGLAQDTAVSIRIGEPTGLRMVRASTKGSTGQAPIPIDVGNAKEWLEDSTEPTDVIGGTGALNGQILKDGERDSWNWQTEKGKQYSLTLLTESLGSPLLADLSVESADGKTVEQFVANPHVPQEAKLTVGGAEQPYVIRIDSKSFGREHAYRLKCEEVKPDFQLTLDTDAVTAYRGQKASLKILVQRAGFKGEIALAIEGLPDDISVESAKIPANKNNATISLNVAEKARVRPLHVAVKGSAEIDGVETVRVASMPTPHAPADRTDVLIGVSMPTPFTLDGVAFETRYGPRGTLFRRHFVVRRNGFSGPLQMKLADRQVRHLQGMTGVEMSLAADKSEFDFGIRIPSWLEMNRTSRTVVMAVGKVVDEQGAEHIVSFSSGAPKDQIVLLTAPCPISIAVAKSSMEVRPNSTLQVEFRIDRGILRPAPARIELIAADHIEGVTATPIELESDQTAGQLALRIGDRPGPFNMPVTLRAITTDGSDDVIAETKLQLVLP